MASNRPCSRVHQPTIVFSQHKNKPSQGRHSALHCMRHRTAEEGDRECVKPVSCMAIAFHCALWRCNASETNKRTDTKYVFVTTLNEHFKRFIYSFVRSYRELVEHGKIPNDANDNNDVDDDDECITHWFPGECIISMHFEQERRGKENVNNNNKRGVNGIIQQSTGRLNQNKQS